MRVLIFSVTAGGGHNSTAAAIEKGLREGGAECHVLDTLQYISPLLGFTISEGYLFVTQHMKKIYGEGYHIGEKRRADPEKTSPTRASWGLAARKIKEYIDEYAPDEIVFTHIFVGIILDVIKQKYGLRPKTVGILTDFAFHPYWEEAKHLDYVITADRALTYAGMRKGFCPDQILPLGIPVNPKFSSRHDRKEMREKYGLDPDLPTVLYMGGSMGYGNMTEVIGKLYDVEDVNFQIAVVCGNNKSALETLQKSEDEAFRKKVVPFGFVDFVDELMDASDILITKPGGLTTSEALCKEIPMIIVNPIPGQEDRNVEFLLNAGAAVAVSRAYPVEEAVYNLLGSPGRIANMRAAIREIRKPDATANICKFLLSGCDAGAVGIF